MLPIEEGFDCCYEWEEWGKSKKKKKKLTKDLHVEKALVVQKDEEI